MTLTYQMVKRTMKFSLKDLQLWELQLGEVQNSTGNQPVSQFYSVFKNEDIKYVNIDLCTPAMKFNLNNQW